MKSKLLAISALAMPLVAFAQTSYTDVTATGAWNTARWNNSADEAPYTSTYTANQNVSFTSGSYSFAGMGASINVGNVNVADGVSVNFPTIGSTFATGGNVRTITVGTGAVLDFNTQSFSTAAGTGFIKEGAGVLALAGNTYNGGFTLNAGTVVVRGVNAMGGGTGNTLTLNGGVIAASATRDLSGKYSGGIVIGGDVQFGELAANLSIASDGAKFTISNNISLGSANRTLTHGNNADHVFSGVISNTGSEGITFNRNPGASGRFDITGTSNTFTGDITIIGGEARFTANGSLGNANNDIYIDGGRFSTAGTSVTLGAGHSIFVGDTPGTAIRSTVGTMIINQPIANISGKTGFLAKQGGQIVELGGISTYTGSTFVEAGILRLTTGDDRLPTGTVVTMGTVSTNSLGTLDLNGRNQTIAGLNSATGTNTTVNTNVVTSATAATLTLNTAAATTHTYSLGTAANSGVISGALSLIKNGDGTQILGGANTYTGNTTVNAGTLELAATGQLKFVLGSSSGVNNSLTGAGTVTLDGDFVIDTTAADALSSGTWVLENVSTLTGPYGATFAVIGFTDAGGDTWTKDIGGGKIYTFNEATGTLTLTSSGTPYTIWAATNAPSGNPDDDFDGDGVSNAIEFVLGGDKLTNDLDKLPVAATSGANMTFTFVRDQDSVDASVSTVIEVGTTLSTWPDVFTVGADTASSTSGVTVTDNGNGTDTIQLSVTRAPDDKKFARLKVVITP